MACLFPLFFAEVFVVFVFVAFLSAPILALGENFGFGDLAAAAFFLASRSFFTSVIIFFINSLALANVPGLVVFLVVGFEGAVTAAVFFSGCHMF